MNTPRRSPAPPLRSSAEQRRGDPGKTSGTMAPAELRDPHCPDPRRGARLLEGHPFRSVVVMGDSVAAGVREPTHGYLDLSMADRLHDALSAGRPDLSFSNLGVTGLKIAEVTATQLDAALERRPDLAVLSAGGNDAFERGFDRDRTTAELNHLVRPALGGGCSGWCSSASSTSELRAAARGDRAQDECEVRASSTR